MAEADGKLLYGQRYDESRDVVIPYTEQMMDKRNADGQVSNARTEILPNDMKSSKVRIWGNPIQSLEDYFLTLAGTTNIDFPPVLAGISVSFNKNFGDGESIHDVGDAAWAGESGGMNLDPTSSAQASASIIPDLQPDIQPTTAEHVPVKIYLFYVEGSTEQSAILTRLTTQLGITVNAWPKFKPVPHTFTLKGQQTSISQQADSHLQYSWSSGNVSYAISPVGGGSPTRSDGFSIETGVSVRTVTLPPTIHGAITLSPTSDTATVEVEVTANIPGVAGSGGAPSFSAITNEPTPKTATVTGSVSPTSLNATGGRSTIPTSGLYLLRVDSEPFAYGYTAVRAVVFDFAYFA